MVDKSPAAAWLLGATRLVAGLLVDDVLQEISAPSHVNGVKLARVDDLFLEGCC